MPGHYGEGGPTIKIVLEGLMGAGTPEHDARISRMVNALPEEAVLPSDIPQAPQAVQGDFDDEVIANEGDNFIDSASQQEPLDGLAQMILSNLDSDGVQGLIERLLNNGQDAIPQDVTPVI